MVSLDSSFLIDLLAGERSAVDRAARLEQSGEDRCLSAPAASEVMVGAYRLGGTYLARARMMVDGLRLLAFDQQAYHEAGRIGADLLRRGFRLGQSDLFIAAISLRHGQRLLTRDAGFSNVPGLAVETY